MSQITGCNYIGQGIIDVAAQSVAENHDDTSRFYIKTVEYQECREYIICRENPDGEVAEIVNMGVREQPLIIEDGRIYYSTGLELVSVDFDGENKKTFSDGGDEIIIEQIYYVDGEWLYCAGRKQTEIYDDPATADGVHYPRTIYKVKADFSEYSEIR
jgi:hypothetical protein